MQTANDLRPGNMVEFDGILYRVTSYQHVKPGKGGGFVRLKLKNVELGTVTDKTLDSWEKVPEASIEEKEMQYLYKKNDKFVFMDLETYEQMELTQDDVGEQSQWLKPEMSVEIIFYKSRPVSIKLPITVDLKITVCEPGVKGDTVSGATKSVQLESGASIKVPLFINEGDTIRVDTRTGEYLERV